MSYILIFGILAADPTVRLGPDNLFSLAVSAYDAGPGHILGIEATGFQDARSLTGGRFTSLSLEALSEVGFHNGDRGEHNLTLASDMSLANLAQLKNDTLASMAAATHLRAADERLHYVLRMQQAYGEAFLAKILSGHIQALYETAQERTVELKQLAEQQLATQADWLAQKALAGAFAAEIREMDGRIEAARNTLESLLAAPVQLAFPETLDLEADRGNPFPELIGLLEKFPEIRHTRALAETARAEARLVVGQNAPILSPNLNYRDEPSGDRWMGFGVRVSFSLRPKRDHQWRRHQAQATALEAQARRQSTLLKAWLIQKEQRYSSILARAESYSAEVLEPLAQQVHLYEKAAEAGHVPRRFQLQTEAELHEAEHAFLEMVHQLWADRAEAQIWKQLLGEDQ